jgi:hypothetical protein
MNAYEIERAARLENGARFGKIAIAFAKADRARDTGGNRRPASAKMKD